MEADYIYFNKDYNPGAINKPDDPDERIADEAFRRLLGLYLASNHRRKVELIQRAYRFARNAHKGVRLRSGLPYIIHPIEVAEIVIGELGLGSTSICAALLHDILERTDTRAEDLQAAFGDKIAAIVVGLTKISGGILGERTSVQAEKFRRLLLSMTADFRVVLIKMADRLNNMRHIDILLPEKQKRIADETLHLYAPLAHRLGLYKIKTELENLVFRYQYPEKYAEITAHLERTEDERTRIINEFISPVREKLNASGFKYEIKSRVKSPYSIFNKMVKKNIPIEEVFDIYAIRVIFENDDDAAERLKCWQIYTLFTDGKIVHPERLRDWTSIPKANGYRALHLTVMGPEGHWIEVQIRSRKMDDIAELGYAAHWKYKTGDSSPQVELDNWMNTLKDILANPGPDAIDFLDTVKLNLYSSEIFLFTPKGELITLPAGSTVVDMAFAIHSDLGMHCVAGKINHRLVEPDYILGSADQVEIITSRSARPRPEWLEKCRTTTARHKLKTYFRRKQSHTRTPHSSGKSIDTNS